MIKKGRVVTAPSALVQSPFAGRKIDGPQYERISREKAASEIRGLFKGFEDSHLNRLNLPDSVYKIQVGSNTYYTDEEGNSVGQIIDTLVRGSDVELAGKRRGFAIINTASHIKFVFVDESRKVGKSILVHSIHEDRKPQRTWDDVLAEINI